MVGGGLALSMYSFSGFWVSLCGASSLYAQHTLLPRQHVGVVKSVVLYERNLPSVPVAHHQSILPDLVATRIASVQTRVNGDVHAPPLVTCRQHVEGLKVWARGLVTPFVFSSTRRVVLRSTHSSHASNTPRPLTRQHCFKGASHRQRLYRVHTTCT